MKSIRCEIFGSGRDPWINRSISAVGAAHAASPAASNGAPAISRRKCRRFGAQCIARKLPQVPLARRIAGINT
jgi:hypothetical protein